MKAVILGTPGGLDRLKLVDMPEPQAPAAGEIRVRLHASSLNYHDYRVVLGGIPTADGRIPMADGAGVVEAVGQGVTEFAVGDHVVSCFFPQWQDGPPDGWRFCYRARRWRRRLCARDRRKARKLVYPLASGFQSRRGSDAHYCRAHSVACAGSRWRPEGQAIPCSCSVPAGSRSSRSSLPSEWGPP